MNKIYGVLSFFLIATFIGGCAIIKDEIATIDFDGTGDKSAYKNPSFPSIDKWLTRNKLSIVNGKDGQMDFERAFAQGVALIYGEGIPAYMEFDPSNKRLTALREAQFAAEKNLADFIARSRNFYDSSKKSSFSFSETYINDAVIVAEEYSPLSERAAVLIKLDIHGAKAKGKDK